MVSVVILKWIAKRGISSTTIRDNMIPYLAFYFGPETNINNSVNSLREIEMFRAGWNLIRIEILLR